MKAKHQNKSISDIRSDLAEKVSGVVPVVELAGNSRVLIEHHKGILEYSRDRIVIKMQYGNLSVQGRCLEITEINAVKIVILGKVDCLQLQSGRCI